MSDRVEPDLALAHSNDAQAVRYVRRCPLGLDARLEEHACTALRTLSCLGPAGNIDHTGSSCIEVTTGAPCSTDLTQFAHPCPLAVVVLNASSTMFQHPPAPNTVFSVDTCY